MNNRLAVCHIITGLSDGGAEAVLYRLCRHDKQNQHRVVSLSGQGKYGPVLQGLGITVTTLNMSPGLPSLIVFFRLVRLLRREGPDVVQTWMYHADLFGGLAALTAGVGNVVWGIRHTSLEPKNSKKSTVLLGNLLAKLSTWLPAKIIVCGQVAMDAHLALGYDCTKMRVIPNGYNLTEFKPGLDWHGEFKASLNIKAEVPLIGSIGRFHPLKGHSDLLDALSILRERGVIFQCVLVGAGLDKSNVQLLSLIDRCNLREYVQLLGIRNDIPAIMNALDIHVLPSLSEGFPNVVAEAMACGTPCVVTDVGEAAYIVGETGWVVPPGDSQKLAESLGLALNQLDQPTWKQRCDATRERIEENFSLDTMVHRYIRVWKETG